MIPFPFLLASGWDAGRGVVVNYLDRVKEHGAQRWQRKKMEGAWYSTSL